MKNIKVLAIYLAKDVFQVHGNDVAGKCAMEACSSSNHWAREFKKMGHEVVLIAPQYVKPFMKTNKNDSADAEAIAEAAARPSMRFVPIKEIWQQEVQAFIVQESCSLPSELRQQTFYEEF